MASRLVHCCVKAPCREKRRGNSSCLTTFGWSVQVPYLFVRPQSAFNYHVLKEFRKCIWYGIRLPNRYLLWDSVCQDQSVNIRKTRYLNEQVGSFKRKLSISVACTILPTECASVQKLL